MRIKTVKRYYCDHCRKGGFFKKKIQHHEEGCTRNKDRVCHVCQLAQETQKPLADLMATLDGITMENSSQKLYKLSEACGRCPACMLAALRHHPSTGYDFSECDEEGRSNIVATGFDFKKSMKEWWGEYNSSKSLHDIQNY